MFKDIRILGILPGMVGDALTLPSKLMECVVAEVWGEDKDNRVTSIENYCFDKYGYVGAYINLTDMTLLELVKARYAKEWKFPHAWNASDLLCEIQKPSRTLSLIELYAESTSDIPLTPLFKTREYTKKCQKHCNAVVLAQRVTEPALLQELIDLMAGHIYSDAELVADYDRIKSEAGKVSVMEWQ